MLDDRSGVELWVLQFAKHRRTQSVLQAHGELLRGQFRKSFASLRDVQSRALKTSLRVERIYG